MQPGAEEPDWELIEKLEEIASKDEVVLPDVPEAPDLDAVASQVIEGVDPTGSSTTEVDKPSWNLSGDEDPWPSNKAEEE